MTDTLHEGLHEFLWASREKSLKNYRTEIFLQQLLWLLRVILDSSNDVLTSKTEESKLKPVRLFSFD
jgi:hypothetical protein